MGRYSFKRSDRVGQLLHREISNILQFEVKDPRVEFVTVTRVRLSDDLKEATVYVSIMGEDKQKPLEGLLAACRFIRARTGERCYLKYVPRLKFELDRALEEAIRIDRLIKSLRDGKESFPSELQPEQDPEEG